MIREELTIIIKVFERSQSLIALLKSIRKSQLKECKIIIADDSKMSLKEAIVNQFTDLNIKYIELEFDSGLSKGRNMALDQVQTEYFLLLDDDFIIDNKVNYNEIIIKAKKLHADILSGYIKNMPLLDLHNRKSHVKSLIKRFVKKSFDKYVEQSYTGIIDLSEKNKWTVTYFLKDFEDKKSDIGLNFFIGNTKKIKAMGGWNDKLKIGEHLEFFVRCKQNNLKVYYTNDLYVYHYPVRYDDYNQYRERGIQFFKIMIDDHNINEVISYYPETNQKKSMYLDENGIFQLVEENIKIIK